MTETPTRLLIGSKNRHKVEEIRAVLAAASVPVEVCSLDELERSVPDVEETASNLIGNAVLKARTFAEQTGLLTLADDSGLEVDALGGAPGVRSARYAGEDATYADNNAKLLAALAEVPEAARGARFVTVLALADPNQVWLTVEGEVRGRILTEPRGSDGFGYDPLFFHPESNATFAELSAEAKNEVSHRSRALRRFADRLQAGGSDVPFPASTGNE